MTAKYNGLCGFLLLAMASAHADVTIDSQAAQGATIYAEKCADCHHLTLHGTAHAPELAGPGFLAKWSGHTVGELQTLIRNNMPPTSPMSLTEESALDLAAHILRINGSAAGGPALQAASTVPVGRVVHGESWVPMAPENGAKPKLDALDATLRVHSFTNSAVKNYTPVTDAMLRQPPPADWLSWRRTLDGQGYSPLSKISRTSVRHLKLAWALTMHEGSNETTPLVHDGVMYLISPGNIVQALDAASGELIWEYAYTFPPEAKTIGGPSRNIAIYKDKVFLSTYDAAIVALDARTGKQAWRTVKADFTKGFTQTSGPIIADGVVISGINGCEQFKPESCFVTGHDPDTGKELWRTHTIAAKGDPNDASWAGVQPQFRAGGDTWIPGSYDADRHLFYIGTAQAKPWMAVSRHMSPLDAALYTDSTLALDPKTGKIVWYYQHVAGETFDMDTVFERVLVDLDGKSYLYTIGKDGILWKLDRTDGKFVDFTETLYQNMFEPLDKSTGRLKYRQDIIDAKIGDPLSVCPSMFGGHNWQATAYSPQNHSLIIPLHQLCVEMIGRDVKMEEGNSAFGADSRVFEMPNVNGMLGRLSAWDLRTMKQRWTYQQRAMFLTGVLTTGGGLAFVGDTDRYFKAFDVDTGKVLWQSRLGAAAHGYPITYSVRGKQYVAVPSGMGVFRLVTSRLSPEIYQPSGGNELYVFELPE